MEGARFDALTRRLLIAGAAGGVIAPLFGSDVVAAKKCKKGSKPCGSRCCPRGQRCENNICVRACNQPATCAPGSRFPACGGFLPSPCACGTTPSGGSVCFQPPPLLTPCSSLTPCDAATPCSSGQVCATACCMTTAQFRCFDPCAGPFP